MIHRFGGFELDEQARELRLNGTDLVLQPRVLDLLFYLVRNRERVVSNEELLGALWRDAHVGEGSLHRAVSLARAALRRGGAAASIRNYARQGYRFLIDATPEARWGTAGPLTTARRASADGDWESAAREFASADRETPLAPADLERFAQAAQCAGKGSSVVEPLERAVRAYLEQDRKRDAARAAASLSQIHLERRELSVAKGWLARAAGFLSGESESRELGLLRWTSARVALIEGNLEQAAACGQEAHRIGKALKDPDVEALGLVYWGLSLLARGDVRRGIDLQDEAAAAVLGGGVSPWSGGLVYCSVIWGCLNRGDWRRAAEWTEQFERWCSEHGLGSLPGLCRLHRAELLTLRGELGEAEEEITEASTRLAASAPWAEGDALRVLGEIHLAKGNLEPAEAAFRRAHELGWTPQPGWALLLLAQGRVDAAVRSLERAVNDSNWAHQQRRGALLGHLAVAAALGGDVERAGRAIEELDERKELWSTPAFEAIVLRARGELALAKGNVEEAAAHLRRSLQIWTTVEASMSAAETRVRLAEIHLETDPDAAELELFAAEAAYRKAGAPSRLERCRELRDAIRTRARVPPSA
jgi:DNA-binding winged helix-turn-helix (wHTH) protein/ATP/maltotriose-dependent transcriptional regulator MalT